MESLINDKKKLFVVCEKNEEIKSNPWISNLTEVNKKKC